MGCFHIKSHRRAWDWGTFQGSWCWRSNLKWHGIGRVFGASFPHPAVLLCSAIPHHDLLEGKGWWGSTFPSARDHPLKSFRFTETEDKGLGPKVLSFLWIPRSQGGCVINAHDLEVLRSAPRARALTAEGGGSKTCPTAVLSPASPVHAGIQTPPSSSCLDCSFEQHEGGRGWGYRGFLCKAGLRPMKNH